MPSIVPGFEYDIFISYRHNDNRSGWVTDFVNALQEELAATIKEPLSIYFDKNPYDGLLETHNVDKSLEGKLRCLIFIPILSQTYCDPKSFAWQHEFCAFNKLSKEDQFGRDIKLSSRNVASRILPIKIHDLSAGDKATIESELGGQLRAIEFIYREPGVNRPLKLSDDRTININKTDYRNQINKTANAISDLMAGLQGKEIIASSAFPDSTSGQPNKKSSKLPSLDKKSSIILLLLASLVTVSVLYFLKPSPDERTYRATLLPPDKTRFTGTYGNNFSLSPDGRTLAFVATDSAGKTNLWVRQLNSMKAQLLAGAEDISLPFWSPDSKYIAFFADSKLKKIEATGGPAQIICHAAQGRGGSWNNDGTIVFSASVSGPISIVSSAGGHAIRITKLDTIRREVSHRWPVFLPDGQHFLYLSRLNASGVNGQDAIFLASIDTTTSPRLLVKASSNVAYANGHLLYANNGALMAQPFDEKSLRITGAAFPLVDQLYFDGLTSMTAFAVSQSGHLCYITDIIGSFGLRLIWRDRTAKALGSINHISALYTNLRLSPDGTMVAISFPDPTSGNMDTWLYETKRKVWTRFTFSESIDRAPIWSPDGKMIVFSSDRQKGFDLYIKPANGEKNEQLLFDSDQNVYATDWSPDGRFIAFQSTKRGGLNDIWILPMDRTGTGKQSDHFPFLNSELNETRATFSPDGRWIAYQSSETGKPEIYVRPFPGPGGKYQISSGGGSRPRWRGDGKELFFMRGTDFRIMGAEIKLGKSSLEVGAVTPYFEFRNITSGGRDLFDVTPDGQQFLIESVPGDEISSPITLIINWPREILKK
jgi:eukaryotic-like serine/threonine-protein kinase